MGLLSVNPNSSFWLNTRVAITGHTGFKGGWLSLYLKSLGARVAGYSRLPTTQPNLFDLCKIRSILDVHSLGDVRDQTSFDSFIRKFQPRVVFHLAAQPLVRYSYEDPLETYQTNILGTVHLLESIRKLGGVEVLVVVTSDKCYDNEGPQGSFCETDSLGGHDPYSASKGCQEIVARSYHRSYFATAGPAMATVRAGNVIGGGDWSKDRLLPDSMRAYFSNSQLLIRYPEAARPWQHVLEPLTGYILLAENLASNRDVSGAYNFGPRESDIRSVRHVLDLISDSLPAPLDWRSCPEAKPHEAQIIKLDSSKALSVLGWQPRWRLERSVEVTCDWYSRAYAENEMMSVCEQSIADFLLTD